MAKKQNGNGNGNGTEKKKNGNGGALVKQEQLAVELLKELEGLDVGSAFEMPSGETIFPFAKLLQALSPEVQDDEVDAKAGDIINNQDKTKITGSYFVPLKFFQEFVVWDEEGKQILHRTQDINDPKLKSLLAGIHEVDDEQALSFAWKHKVIYILAWLIQEKYPILIPCSKTSYKAGLNLYRTCRLKGKKMFISVFKLGSKLQTKDKYKYYVLHFTPAGYIKKKQVLDKVIEAFNNLKDLHLYNLVASIEQMSETSEPKKTEEAEVEVVEEAGVEDGEEVVDADF